MKTNNLYVLLGLLILVFASCAKMDQTPKSSATDEAIFGSENGLALYANSFYEILPTANDIHRGDAMADYAARTQVPDFLLPGGYDSRLSTGWSTDVWNRLRNLNFFMENCNDERVALETRNHYIGLARFFRAWFYFDMVKRFGDVPWINTPFNIDDPGLFASRDSRALVIDSVLADLDYAIANIRTVNDATRSQITVDVASAFKSRVCLFEGTFRKYQVGYNLAGSSAGLLEMAASSAKAVIDGGNFNLYTGAGTELSYRNLFISDNPIAEEVMLSSVMSASLNVLNDANWYWTSATYGARLSLIRTFVNTYLMEDGSRFTDRPGYEQMTFMQEVKSRDKRLQQTIRLGGYQRINGTQREAAPPLFSYTYTGYQPIKWTLDNVFYDSGANNTNSICIIRYAEVLLNYAEALAELGRLGDSEWDLTVAALRRRAGIMGELRRPMLADAYLQTNYFPEIADPALLEVRRERSIELVFEGHRFFDLIRWKKGELTDMEWNGFYVPQLNTPLDLNEDGVSDVVFVEGTPSVREPGVTYINIAQTISSGENPQQLKNGTSGQLTWLNNVSRRWDDKLYLYPIPFNELVLNPELGQNPGWE